MPKWTLPTVFIAFLGLGCVLWLGVEPLGRPVLSGAMVALGLALLVIGADYMVHGAVRLARRLGVAPFVIGVTIVGFGTSAPELAASVGATLAGKGPLAIGNVLGSNIANICLILGTTALIRPIPVERSVWRVDAPVMLAITFAASFSMFDLFFNPEATVGPIDGTLLVIGLVAYVWYNTKAGRIDPEGIEQEVEIELGETRGGAGVPAALSILTPFFLVGAGLAGLILGARLLVDGAESIATAIGVSEAIIGLTVVAFGTSVPELVFSARAAMKDHPEIAIGNIIGSNVFNLLSVLGIASLIRPIGIPEEAINRDIWFVWGVTALCLFMMKSQQRVTRLEGAFLLGGYIAYTVLVYVR